MNVTGVTESILRGWNDFGGRIVVIWAGSYFRPALSSYSARSELVCGNTVGLCIFAKNLLYGSDRRI